ncbi:ShTK domain protein, partial [Trichostrongylus colubriformis]
KKMHFLLLSSTLIIGVVRSQQIADLNCTETAQNVTKYALSAVNCENKLSDEECAVLYPTAVQMNTSNPRDAKCTGNSTALNSHLIETAIQLCPKTCGYCCLTPAYACNDKAGAVCGTDSRCEIWVRKGFCKSDYYSLEYKMQYCGRACGLC